MSTSQENSLGAFLKDRRAKLDPTALGFNSSRRRTPGLRREEVAQRADVSATWYTWLEQGRGGAPSADVLDRLSSALLLNEAEREHLYLLAQHRPPEARYRESEGVTPRLQRILDSFEVNPALIRTSTWDIIAWNRPAAMVLYDYSTLPPEGRNILRLLFCTPDIRAKMLDWESHARMAVSTFRLDVARAGFSEKAAALVEELCQKSPEFESMWLDNDVSMYVEGTKHFRHPVAGPLALEYSAFAVDGQPDLGMVIYTPATEEDAERVRSLLAGA